MRRAIAAVALGLMAVGLTLTAFGTRTTFSTQSSPLTLPPSCNGKCEVLPGLGCDVSGGCGGYFSLTPPLPHSDFTLNYIGGFLAILSAVGFVIALPPKRSRAVVSPNFSAFALY